MSRLVPQLRTELTLMLRNGEQVLLTLGIPITTALLPEPAQASGPWISPNPMGESALLRMDEKQSGASDQYVFELFDTQGRQVLVAPFIGPQMTILRGGLSTGAYFYVLKTTDGLPLGSGIILLD